MKKITPLVRYRGKRRKREWENETCLRPSVPQPGQSGRRTSVAQQWTWNRILQLEEEPTRKFNRQRSRFIFNICINFVFRFVKFSFYVGTVRHRATPYGTVYCFMNGCFTNGMSYMKKKNDNIECEYGTTKVFVHPYLSFNLSFHINKILFLRNTFT